MSFTLNTARLKIRPWTPADAESAFAIYGDARVMRYLGSGGATGGSPPIASVEAMRENLERRAARPPSPDGLPGLLAIVEKETDVPVGSVLLSRLPDGEGKPTADVEIGWHLRQDRWGRGYATEAARAMAAYAFEILRLAEVHAIVYADNAGSLRVCERLGMTHLGQTGRYYGVTVEHYRLRADDLK